MKPPHALVLLSALFLAIGLGGLAPAASSHSLSFARAASYGVGDSPGAVAVGDVNADGKPDLVVSRGAGDGTEGTVGVMLNQGAGTFGPRQDFQNGSDPGDVTITDLDGDGVKDLVTANYYADTVSLFRGTGGAGFGTPLSYPMGGAIPVAVAAGDLNRDGLVDLALAGSASNSVAVMVNSPYGFWGPLHTDTGENPIAIALGDVNRDGNLDAVTANGLAASVSVLKGDGSPRFAIRNDYGVGDQPFDVALGDLNGDGAADLATANSDADTVSVLLNDGSGGYAVRRDYTVGATPTAVAIADLNGDGRGDVTAANATGNSVSILLGKGDGTLEARRDYRAGDGPRSLALADLNGDGRLDLTTANGFDSTASVLLNSPGLCDVPDVSAKSVRSTRATLARYNCRLGKVVRRHSRTVRAGRVISQKPGFGAVLRAGGKVKLVVSLGRKR